MFGYWLAFSLVAETIPRTPNFTITAKGETLLDYEGDSHLEISTVSPFSTDSSIEKPIKANLIAYASRIWILALDYSWTEIIAGKKPRGRTKSEVWEKKASLAALA